jgi:hypothetical protein
MCIDIFRVGDRGRRGRKRRERERDRERDRERERRFIEYTCLE